MGEALNARADDIIRTTQARHKEAALEIWRRMEQTAIFSCPNTPAGIPFATRPITTRAN